MIYIITNEYKWSEWSSWLPGERLRKCLNVMEIRSAHFSRNACRTSQGHLLVASVCQALRSRGSQCSPTATPKPPDIALNANCCKACGVKHRWSRQSLCCQAIILLWQYVLNCSHMFPKHPQASCSESQSAGRRERKDAKVTALNSGRLILPLYLASLQRFCNWSNWFEKQTNKRGGWVVTISHRLTTEGETRVVDWLVEESPSPQES